jgi:hypothetical protein
MPGSVRHLAWVSTQAKVCIVIICSDAISSPARRSDGLTVFLYCSDDRSERQRATGFYDSRVSECDAYDGGCRHSVCRGCRTMHGWQRVWVLLVITAGLDAGCPVTIVEHVTLTA